MFPATDLTEYFEKLAENSWVLIPIDAAFAGALARCCEKRLPSFRPATITRERSNKPDIRNDSIFWLEHKLPDLSETERSALVELDRVRDCLKNFFRISLTEFECHFSHYKDGQAYAVHVDTTPTDNRRFFSFVIYLNADWKAADGGQTVGYREGQTLFEINPEMGHALVFKSDVPHEVRRSFRSRMALTGWMRK